MTDMMVLNLDRPAVSIDACFGMSSDAYTGMNVTWVQPTFNSNAASVEMRQNVYDKAALSGLIQNLPNSTNTTLFLTSTYLPRFNQQIADVRMRYIQGLVELFPSLASRLHVLAKAADGWDGYDAKGMSFESLGQLRRFLCKSGLPSDDVGLYLESDGLFILSFTSRHSGLVDMTFLADKIIFCTDDSEQELSLEEALDIVKEV